MESIVHQPVLLHEAVEGLQLHPDGIYVDATFGRGGHSALILSALGPKGRLIAFDRDPQAVACAQSITDPRFEIIHAPFSELVSRLAERGVSAIDGLLIDLGVSSPQIDDPARGFSFRSDGPLDMRMDPTRGQPVSVWLMQTSIDELKKVIADYGEERFAFQIADAITTRCEAARRGDAAPLESTKALADLVAATLRRCRARPEPGQHPATRTFQALRIHINGELDELVVVLQAALELLRESGRLAVISFHSIEDRIVKQFIRDWSGKAPRSTADRTLTRAQEALLETITHQQSGGESSSKTSACLKPVARIRPSAAEIARNPRARSATLRIAERLPHLHRGRA